MEKGEVGSELEEMREGLEWEVVEVVVVVVAFFFSFLAGKYKFTDKQQSSWKIGTIFTSDISNKYCMIRIIEWFCSCLLNMN